VGEVSSASHPGSCYLRKAPGWPVEALRTQGQPGAQPILERSNLKNAPPAEPMLQQENHSGKDVVSG
jgi:hypothetical protein